MHALPPYAVVDIRASCRAMIDQYLPYRQTEGVVRAHATNRIPSIPDYSTINRRVNNSFTLLQQLGESVSAIKNACQIIQNYASDFVLSPPSIISWCLSNLGLKDLLSECSSIYLSP
jgi:hypothetical protein